MLAAKSHKTKIGCLKRGDCIRSRSMPDPNIWYRVLGTSPNGRLVTLLLIRDGEIDIAKTIAHQWHRDRSIHALINI